MIFAGGGFHEMAWRLANLRVHPHGKCRVIYNMSREAVEASPVGCYPVHREYYKILDAASFKWRYRHDHGRTVTL